MENSKERYTITELSEVLNITDHTLRYYEKEFNFEVPRDARGRRYYTPELAKIIYQIKNMRKEGLEIKAIRKILISKNIIKETHLVTTDKNSISISVKDSQNTQNDLVTFFSDFKEQITSSITAEVICSKDHLTREILKSKLELGACVENSIRKLEYKMERHFNEVDRSIGMWREKNKKGLFKNLSRKKPSIKPFS